MQYASESILSSTTPVFRPQQLAPARELFFSLPAVVRKLDVEKLIAGSHVRGLFFNDSFDEYERIAQASRTDTQVKALALSLLSHRDQIEGRLLSALADTVEWNRRMRLLMSVAEHHQ